jgi:putative transferase (TIGR04331 family)
LVNRFLVTTALEETWPIDPEVPVLFLGEWCRIYSRKERWSIMNAEVLSYHWDDRNKLYNDYQYLNNIYENTLKSLQKKLNEIHKVDHSLRYWRILIGPWLGCFLQMVFDRWTMLKHAFEKYGISGCRVLVKDVNTVIPNDLKEFNNRFIDDNWNEMIFSQLIQEHIQNDIIIEQVLVNSCQPKQFHQSNRSFKSWLGGFKRFFMSTYMKHKQWFHDSDKYFFFYTYLPQQIEEELLLRLGQNPQYWETPITPMIETNMQMRKTLSIEKYNSFDKFPSILSQMIPQQIPTVYLEGYNSLVDCIEYVAWPKPPKCIFTSNAYWSNDVFKAWAAQQTENGVPLVIGQHGGHHGMTPWSFHEEHQINISDAWLSWGWTNDNSPNIVPVGNLKAIDHTIDYDPNGMALMVEMALPRYSYHMFTTPVAGQWLSYFEDQRQFIYCLPEHLQKQVIVRLNFHDFKWCQTERWMNYFPEIQLDSGKQPILNLVGNSRLYISTYNATTYLESLAWNMPTIIFWNPNHWEMKDEALPYFELLKSANIFHETPESAAKHMIEIWDDIPAWWQSVSVQNNRKEFCDRYSHIPEKPLDVLETIFRNITS